MAEVEINTAEKTEGSATKSTEAAKEIAKETMEAFNLLAQGKRNILCGEVPQAVNQLQEACRLLAAKYGETADQCGEAYLCYGSALLDLSRMESGVLGNALQGIDEDDEASSKDDSQVEDPDKVTEEDREKISEQVIDAMTEEREAEKKKEAAKENGEATKENGEAAKENGEAPKENGEAAKENGEAKANGVANGDAQAETNGVSDEKKEKKDSEDSKEGDTEEDEEEEDEGEKSEDIGEEEGEEAEGEKAEGEKAEEEKTEGKEGETSEGKTEEKKEEEDVSNLQLAWEMLELAKVIYSRHDSKEMKLKTAEAFLKLGEVGLETDQYDQAICDFKECLKLQKEFMEPESRLIAQTHYQIGLACMSSAKYDEAIENYKSAVSVLEARIAKLDKVIEDAEKEGKGKEVSAFDDPVTEARKEIADLKELLPDILAKIEDTEDEKKSQEKVKQMVKENMAADLGSTTVGFGESSTSTAAAAASSSTEEAKPIQDISHLVRKKRKPEEEAEAEEAKKPRQETEGAGDAKTPTEDAADSGEKKEADSGKKKKVPTATLR